MFLLFFFSPSLAVQPAFGVPHLLSTQQGTAGYHLISTLHHPGVKVFQFY